ncbi:MAG TPA: precorrin-2 C(20)-methyltransferase [Rhizobiales bacterium]|nr:precorrin-2 C(20)-methyltransferase [Hyphomicrobiales bacterium]
MAGRFYGIGLGPGDPELMTLKAVRLLRSADVIAYPTAKAGSGVSLGIIQEHLRPSQELFALVYPVTAGPGADAPDYRERINGFYAQTSTAIAGFLEEGRDVAIPCVGDPFFYGSFMYWYGRLSGRFETIVVPGISSILAGAIATGKPLCFRTQTVTVIPGTLPEGEIVRRLGCADAAVIIKLGRTFAKVRRALEHTGMMERAIYVERASMETQRVMPAAQVKTGASPYFSMVVIPGGEID